MTIAFVHPGYLRRKDFDADSPGFISAIRDCPEYGSYQEYLANLKQLYSMTKTGVFFVERQESHLHEYMEGFEPKEDSVVFEWIRGNTFTLLEKRKHKWIESRDIKKDELGTYFCNNGIRDLVLAGELGPYGGESDGCVGHLCSLLKKQLRVVGARGCIFPLFPIGGFGKRIQQDQPIRELVRKLYEDALPVLK